MNSEHKRSWTPAMDDKLCRMILKEIDLVDIAFDLKMSEDDVRLRINHLGINKSDRPFDSDDWEMISLLAGTDKVMSEVAEMMGVEPKFLRREVYRVYGIPWMQYKAECTEKLVEMLYRMCLDRRRRRRRRKKREDRTSSVRGPG